MINRMGIWILSFFFLGFGVIEENEDDLMWLGF